MSARVVRSVVKRALERQGFNTSAYPHVKCDGCQPVVVSGVPCHELGCPKQMEECTNCGTPVPKRTLYCEDCQDA